MNDQSNEKKKNIYEYILHLQKIGKRIMYYIHMYVCIEDIGIHIWMDMFECRITSIA